MRLEMPDLALAQSRRTEAQYQRHAARELLAATELETTAAVVAGALRREDADRLVRLGRIGVMRADLDAALAEQVCAVVFAAGGTVAGTYTNEMNNYMDSNYTSADRGAKEAR